MTLKTRDILQLTFILSAAVTLSGISAAETEVTATTALDYRYFIQDPLYTSQLDSQLSFSVEAEIYHHWNNELDSITFKPFIRWDREDDQRSHADIRELMWLHVGDDWELRTGIGFVYWGQTESLHLVDVINQTDTVEAFDGEDKLGQAMINLTLIRDWGNLDLFVLPGFRERTFPGTDGRLRPELIIDQNNVMYESDKGQDHVDFAARWTHTVGDWDLGVSYFDGTSRDPYLVPTLVETNIQLTPYYAQMQQVGLDLLVVKDDWLYKFEGIYRDTSGQEDYFAIIAGYEYTKIGVMDSVWDIGWLMEIQYDDRGNQAPTPGQNDLMMGSRLVLNDVDGTELLLGLVQDLDNSTSRSGFIEASSRINNSWKWRLEGWFFASSDVTDPVYSLRRDDYFQFSIEHYF